MRLFLLLFFLYSCSWAIGHTSVSTLAFPHGSENSGLGESGAAFSNGLSSVFYNPANGVMYANREKINVAISGFNEDILPSLGLDNLWYRSLNLGYFMPDLIPNWSLGLSYSRNHLNFGKIIELVESDLIVDEVWYEVDEFGNIELKTGYIDSSSQAYEYVNSFSFSGAYKDRFALGIGVSHFHSVLHEDIAVADGWAIDLGVRAQYEFSPSEKTYLLPGIGISVTGLDNDPVEYLSKESSDSVDSGDDTSVVEYDAYTPHTLHAGISLEGGIRHFLYGVVVFDIHQELIKDRQGLYDDPIFSPGLQVGFTPFLKFNNGFLIDKQGRRYEYHWGGTVGFQQNRVRDYLKRRFGYSVVDTDMNLQILYSFSRIEPWGDNTVRSRQFSQTLSLAMGFGKKRKTEDVLEKDELPLWTE